MKTTIEIADDLLTRAKRQADREDKTLREIVEEALRQRLTRAGSGKPFHLRKHTFSGQGLQPQATEGQWDVTRDLIYRLG